MKRSTVTREIAAFTLSPSAYMAPILYFECQVSWKDSWWSFAGDSLSSVSEDGWFWAIECFNNEPMVVVDRGTQYPLKGIGWVRTEFVLFITLTLATPHGDVAVSLQLEREGVV